MVVPGVHLSLTPVKPDPTVLLILSVVKLHPLSLLNLGQAECILRLLHLTLTWIQSILSLHPLLSLTLGQMYNLSLHPAGQLLVDVDQALWPKNSHLN